MQATRGRAIGYGIGGAPEPIAADMPPMFVPLQELENLALGTWYVNVLAVLSEYRLVRENAARRTSPTL